jgi:hypothetical protein
LTLRRLLTLLLVGLIGWAAPAGASGLTVEIVEHGLYTADVTGHRRDPSGVISNVIENLCHIATTATVPMRPGIHFGFRYRLDGLEPGEFVPITLAVEFPKAVQPPDGPKPIARHQRGSVLPVGVLSYTGYSFDHDWEFMPGTWTMEVLQGDRTLAAMSFTVVDRPAPAMAAPGASSCFRISSL